MGKIQITSPAPCSLLPCFFPSPHSPFPSPHSPVPSPQSPVPSH
ncbi:hypothetical protein [Sphaerospermopsis sp. FACHB-1194]|nr:hypothetical protein [Sphaerospermopsis sp. FACHB-1194]